MRISDWSSDVCSSDLQLGTTDGGLSRCEPCRNTMVVRQCPALLELVQLQYAFPEFPARGTEGIRRRLGGKGGHTQQNHGNLPGKCDPFNIRRLKRHTEILKHVITQQSPPQNHKN